jgi:hypothetical protein
MTEDEFLRWLPLADPLRIAAVDLALTGAPRCGWRLRNLSARQLQRD